MSTEGIHYVLHGEDGANPQLLCGDSMATEEYTNNTRQVTCERCLQVLLGELRGGRLEEARKGRRNWTRIPRRGGKADG